MLSRYDLIAHLLGGFAGTDARDVPPEPSIDIDG
jgi:hypothetical protein